jgi:hypothetical protein
MVLYLLNDYCYIIIGLLFIWFAIIFNSTHVAQYIILLPFKPFFFFFFYIITCNSFYLGVCSFFVMYFWNKPLSESIRYKRIAETVLIAGVVKSWSLYKQSLYFNIGFVLIIVHLKTTCGAAYTSITREYY